MIYVLTYPTFEGDQYHTISRFRTVYEPDRAELVGPHITLVFGLKNATLQEIDALCDQVAAQTAPVSVEFSSHEIAYDPFEKTYKIFLLISEGADGVIRLHERLYAGLRRSEFDPNSFYRPHMTVATNVDRAILEDIDVDSIGSFPIKATVSGLEIVSLARGQLSLIKSIPFGA